jgi:CSLREA domain-containing protein
MATGETGDTLALSVDARVGALSRCLAAMLVLSALMASQAMAETITVNTTVDTYSAGGGSCSLREAVTAASTDVPFAACPGGRGIDVIVLPAGTYVLTIPPSGANDNASGDLDITGTEGLTIDGAGASSTTIVAGGGALGGIEDRILHISSAASVTIEGVEITGGLGIAGADGAPNSSDNGQPGAAGGGVLDSGGGDLTITDSLIQNNTSGAGGAGGSGASGGGQGGNGGPGGTGGGIAKTGGGTPDHQRHDVRRQRDRSGRRGGCGKHGGRRR